MHSIPTSAAGRSGPAIPCGKAKRRAGTGRVPALVGDAGQPDGQVVGQRVLKRLEATRDTLPGRTVGWERPLAEGRMGMYIAILPDADRGMPRWGVAPIHGLDGRIGIAAPAAVAQPPARQRHTEPAALSIADAISLSGDPRSTMYTRGSASVRAPGGRNGSPDRRLERHHGEDVGGRDAIVVRLRLGDNPVAGAAADMRAVRRSGMQAAPAPGGRGSAPPAQSHRSAGLVGDRRGNVPRQPAVIPRVCWLVSTNHADSRVICMTGSRGRPGLLRARRG